MILDTNKLKDSDLIRVEEYDKDYHTTTNEWTMTFLEYKNKKHLYENGGGYSYYLYLESEFNNNIQYPNI